MRRHLRDTSDDRGAVAIELALVLPVLLLLIFGIIEFGFAFNTQLALTQAAREGVRVEAMDTDDGATVAQDSFIAASVGGTPVGQVITDCDSDDYARVSLTIDPYTFLLLPGSITLSGEAVMRCEG